MSLIGTWLQRVAIGWLTWELTESGTWLGIIAFSDLFPTVILSPLAGALADRHDRVALVRTVQFLCAIQATALAVLTATGTITIASLFALSVVMGTLNAFGQPARLALISALVRADSLGTAVAINSVTFNTARFVGPMIAGYTIAHGGTAIAFATNAVSFLVFAAALSRLPADRPPVEPGRTRSRGAMLAEAIAGYRYVARHPGLGPLFLLYASTAVAGRGFVELLPGFADEVFARGPIGLAWMTSSMGVGAIVAGVTLAGRGGTAGITRMTVFNTLTLALAVLAFATVRRFELALAALAVAGFALVATGAGLQTVIQNAVDAGMRGRVLGLYGTIFRGGTALSALIAGAVSEFAGLALPVAIGAALCIAIWAWAITRVAAIAAIVEAPPREPD